MRDIDELMRKIDERIQSLDLGSTHNMNVAKTQENDDLFVSQSQQIGGCLGSGEKALVQLILPRSKAWMEANGLQGKFSVTKSEGEVFFHAQTQQGSTVKLPSAAYLPRLLPLFRLLQEKDYEMELSGSTNDNIFHVYEFHVIAQVLDGKRFSVQSRGDEKRVKYLLRRLLGLRVDIDEPAFSTQEELNLLFRVCKYDYPPSIRNWAEQSFSSLTVSGLGSTDRRHILKGLSYILNIDWATRPLHVPDIAEIRARLDHRFYGLETVKQRILEIAAQLRSTQTLPKWGILLNGPAGVGKTSVANAISDILGMPRAYLEFSVLRDSEVLTGSSRIYDNGKPGLVIEQLYAKRTANLVMVLNEVDKAAENKSNSSPLDMLLPLLDGMGFTDTYIETTIPTDGIFFIATSNEADKISKPILDRFYRIDIPAYSTEEKAVIFDRYILPQALEKARLEPKEVTLTSEARACLLKDYALEPGARDLERMSEKLVSNYLLKKEEDGVNNIIFSKDDLRKMLGPSRKVRRRHDIQPGMAVGAYCWDGRVNTFIFQAAVQPGCGRLELINVEGEYQQEYCRLAYESVNLLTGNRLSVVDVVLAATVPIRDVSPGNYVGCAACAAILSALQGKKYQPGDLFLGGCDLYGSLYLDERTIDPYLKQLSGQVRTIYSAVGTSGLIFDSHPQARVNILEAPNISILYQMAAKNWTHSL